MEEVEGVKKRVKGKENRYGKRYGLEVKLRCVKLRLEEGIPVSLLSKEVGCTLLPTVQKIQESQPIEEVYLIRDEVANMVWGIETRIILPSGISKSGSKAALELHSHYRHIAKKGNALSTETENENQNEKKANINYQIMGTVPENWIPFVPVHKDNDCREIQLRRASMPRIIDNKDMEKIKEKIKPRTVLLSTNPQVPYLIYEEEVPRAGVRIYQSYQRTRWYKGKVVNWVGIKKQTGRDEGASGLAFDQIVPIKKAK